MLDGLEDPPAPPPTAILPGSVPIPPTIGAQPVLPPPDYQVPAGVAPIPPAVGVDPTASFQAPPPPAVPPAALATQDDQALRAATTDQEKAKADLAKADQAGLDAQAAEKQRAADEYKKRLDDYQVHLDASRADIKAAQDKAANTPFHEFQLSTARQIVASLGMILGGASYDPNHVNQAVNIYQDAIKQDFAKQQAEHAKLLDGVKAAQDAGKALSEDQYRGMAELEKSQALKLEAVISQSEKLASVSKNTLAIADLHAKNQELRAASSEKLENAARLEAAARETERHNKAEEGIARGRLAIEREHAKAAAAKDRTEAEIKPISAELDKDEARLLGSAKSLGLIAKQQAIRGLGDNLRSAAASGDPQAVTAATIAGLESISKLNTGGVPNKEVLHLQQALKGDPATAGERIAKLLGNPKTSDQMVRGLLTELDQADEVKLKEIDREHRALNLKYNAEKVGIAKTEAQRNHAAGRLNAIFNGITTRGPNGETERYAPPTAKTAPAAASKTTVVQNKDGTTSTFDANGNLVKP
jgi:hypothetical protein